MRVKVYYSLIFILVLGLCSATWAVTPLSLCEPYSGSFQNDGERLYFEVHVEAGENLLVTFDGCADSQSSLYIKYNQILTTSEGSFLHLRSGKWFSMIFFTNNLKASAKYNSPP